MTDERKTVLFSDLGNELAPREAMTERLTPSAWRRVPYETRDFKGSLVVAGPRQKVPPLTLSPRLRGWYRIFLGVVGLGSMMDSASCDNYVWVRLSGDPAYTRVRAADELSYQTVDEFFFRCEDMTDKTLTFLHPEAREAETSCLALVRFEPMTEEEVEKELAERERRDTKRIYACEDMHGCFIQDSPREVEPFFTRMAPYRHSDVGVLALEYPSCHPFFSGEGVPEEGSPFWGRRYEEYAALSIRELRKKGIDPYKAMIAHGRKLGIEMHLSQRINPHHEFPLDDSFHNPIYERRELWMQDRDGTPISRLSMAYPEVQKHVADAFSRMAEYDVDGVDLLFNRGYPLMEYEEPFLRRVWETYGVDARVLSGYDERLVATRCAIINEFLRDLRARLDRERAARGQRPVKITAQVHRNLRGCRFVGLDLPTWAKEGLVDTVVTYPLEHYEDLPEEVWEDGAHTRVNLAAYTAMMDRGFEGYYDAGCGPLGVKCYDIPFDDEAQTRELVEVFRDSPVKLYVHIMPRHLQPAEAVARAEKLYALGVDGIGLWDTECRAGRFRWWTASSRLGHRGELGRIPTEEGVLYRTHRLLTVGKDRIDRFPPHWTT
jgi:hypothetical protein